MQVEFKYDIGDILTMKANSKLFAERYNKSGGAWSDFSLRPRSRMLALTVLSQHMGVYPGGIHLSYKCRAVSLDTSNGVYVDRVDLDEGELTPYPEPEPAPGPKVDQCSTEERVMTIDELVEKLRAIREIGDNEEMHMRADDALMEYIDSERVSEAYDKIGKGYD